MNKALLIKRAVSFLEDIEGSSVEDITRYLSKEFPQVQVNRSDVLHVLHRLEKKGEVMSVRKGRFRLCINQKKGERFAHLTAVDELASLPPHQQQAELLEAARHPSGADSVLELIQCGVDVNEADNKGRTALHFATAAKRLRTVRLLLESNADPNAQDRQGTTPLILASTGNNVAVVEALLAAGADAHISSASGSTPASLASSRLRRIIQSADQGEESTFDIAAVREEAEHIIQALAASEKALKSGVLDALAARVAALRTKDDADDLSRALEGLGV